MAGEMAGQPELGRGLSGVSEDDRAWVRTAERHRRQVFTKTAGHVLTKVRGTAGDGRGWVRTAEAEKGRPGTAGKV